MCKFKYCKNNNRCLLAKISPCPEYAEERLAEEFVNQNRRPVSASRRGFVDIEEVVNDIDSAGSGVQAAVR